MWSKGADDAAHTQADLDRKMARIKEECAASGSAETQPRLDYAPYRSSILRHPTKELPHADPETIELHAPDPVCIEQAWRQPGVAAEPKDPPS